MKKHTIETPLIPSTTIGLDLSDRSGNFFADLDLPNVENLLVKAVQVAKIIPHLFRAAKRLKISVLRLIGREFRSSGVLCLE